MTVYQEGMPSARMRILKFEITAIFEFDSSSLITNLKSVCNFDLS